MRTCRFLDCESQEMHRNLKRESDVYESYKIVHRCEVSHKRYDLTNDWKIH
jgi:hypothetical protein